MQSPRAAQIVAPPKEEATPWLPKQKMVHDFYQGQKIQISVAVLIVCNFIFSISEKEIDPYPKDLKLYGNVWEVGTACFNVIFLIELILNFYGNVGWKNFFKGGWNIFDTLIVALGTISLFETFSNSEILPPSLSLLRPFRAFRVFRLFKRVPSLNKIMVSLVKAVPGVANAFLIMVIIMCIYAILAVEFFADFGADSTYTTFQDHERRGVDAVWATDENGIVWENATVSAITARGFTWGEEYYGNFGRALYTLFQVLTGESWSEAVARPTMFGQSAALTGIFYVTFIIIMQIVMLNVVVAVLLEKMVDDSPPPGEEDNEVERKSAAPAPAPMPLTCDGAGPALGLKPMTMMGDGPSTDSPASRTGASDLADAKTGPHGAVGHPAACATTSTADMQAMKTQIDYMQAQMHALCAALKVPNPPMPAGPGRHVLSPSPLPPAARSSPERFHV